MSEAMSSRERMLCAIEGKAADYVPLSFMIFSACEQRCAGPFEFFERQVELGLDPVVDLWHLNADEVRDAGDAPGPPVTFGPEVRVREWREVVKGERYPLLHKEYATPAGTLACTVQQTDDWASGDHVPFLDDYIEARATKPLVTRSDDLPALRYLLAPPRRHELSRTRQLWAKGTRFAHERGLLSAAGWGIGADALAWLCGLQDSVMMAMDQPELLDAVLDVVSRWNHWRMEVMLDAKPDLLVRRAWYEGTDFWSPALYRRFLFPRLAAEVRMAHQAGAKFGYILTSGAMPLLDMIIEAGVDVLIGVDPIQGKGTDMAEMKRRTAGKLALWGGVNGFLTVERGTPEGIREAVRLALDTLGPDGFILSPVDNIRDTSDEVWRNTMALIEAWREMR
ncbi:MAG TPA: uroporphyrinogen decarboxylase family protein [Planctomycetota bacterium]|nr:uroporphyrinogen decarboxylase family protein [Planctomycetota bacterium]HRR79772.1 uroporphyrinogen decarboxylase family protein [Planctomycetota bacterium]HRT94630.1 uroporphyrinogen decarboxylase family protein [Planctomycetota bacterium]